MSNRKLPSTQAQNSRLAIVQRSIADLRLDAPNPRQHSPKQIGQIGHSMETFGFNVPVLVDASGKVIAGHGRVLACKKLGWTEVPTICLDHLTEAQARAYMIADNRLAETSNWDDELLAEALRELSVMELEFSLDAIGFEMGEIDFRIESSVATGKRTGSEASDDLPAPPPGPSQQRGRPLAAWTSPALLRLGARAAELPSSDAG